MIKKRKIALWAVAFWLIVWEIASISIGQEILLVSPVDVLIKLKDLIVEAEFWHAIGFTLIRIIGGFLLALVLGLIFAIVSVRYRFIRELLEPFIRTIKAIPVASFIILVLIWISSANLSIVISFLMVFPIIYTNIYEGIVQTDAKMIEMADVFKMDLKQRVRYIYCSQVIPYLQSACSISLGMCWKAGIAAEVIGMPDNSIGENLYNAKIFFDTPSLFAWTVVIICISIIFEKLFMKLISMYIDKLERAL